MTFDRLVDFLNGYNYEPFDDFQGVIGSKQSLSVGVTAHTENDKRKKKTKTKQNASFFNNQLGVALQYIPSPTVRITRG